MTRSEHVPTGSVFRIEVFRAIFVADVVSVFGTQLARFALTVLVFDRTSSVAAAALTYATSFLPSAFGVVLGRIGDRHSKRVVMIVSDILCAALIALVALPGLPLPAIVACVALTVFLGAGFGSAQLAYLAEALTSEQLRRATAWRATSDQVVQIAGFGLGGAVAVLVGPANAILLDGATFVFSALIASAFLPADRPGRADRHSSKHDGVVAHAVAPEAAPAAGPAFAGLWRDTRTRLHMTLMVLIGLFVLPEALAVSYSSAIGADTVHAGLLLATIPLGSALGCAVIVKVPPGRRAMVTNRLAVACGVPLLGCALEPGWLISSVCWFAAGLLTAYQVEVISGLVSALPAPSRSHLIAVAGTWLTVSQALGFAVGGMVAPVVGTGLTIAGAAGCGCVAAWIVTRRLRNDEEVSPMTRRHTPLSSASSSPGFECDDNVPEVA